MVQFSAEVSFGQRLKSVVAIGTLSVLGTAGIAACGPGATAEKVSSATSAGATTGAPETPAPVNSPETSSSASGMIGAIDIAGLTK